MLSMGVGNGRAGLHLATSRYVATLRALTCSRALVDVPFIMSCDSPEEWPCFCLLLSGGSVVPLVSKMNGGLASLDDIMFALLDCDFPFGLQHGFSVPVPTRACPTRHSSRSSVPLQRTQECVLRWRYHGRYADVSVRSGCITCSVLEAIETLPDELAAKPDRDAATSLAPWASIHARYAAAPWILAMCLVPLGGIVVAGVASRRSGGTGAKRCVILC
ncbi:hypothetical protein V8D89_004525 [Ganoderma adspersum]